LVRFQERKYNFLRFFIEINSCRRFYRLKRGANTSTQTDSIFCFNGWFGKNERNKKTEERNFLRPNTVHSDPQLLILAKRFFRDLFQKFIIFVVFNLRKDVFRDFLKQSKAIFWVFTQKGNNTQCFGEFLELNQRFLRLFTKNKNFRAF
jgi:hypothetical protein